VIVLGALGANAVAASDSHTSSVGEVAFAPPVPITAIKSSAWSIRPDPVQGGWAVISAPAEDKLVRIDEDGRVNNVPLPAALRGWQLAFTPLKDGWGVATARVFPGGRGEETGCSEGSTERCGVMVVAQLSPKGRWTRVRRLPHSSGSDSSGFQVPADAIESDGWIELTWCQECLGGGQVFWIAVARPGGAFGVAHIVQLPLHIEAENEFVETFRGRFYLRAQFGPHGDGGEGRHIVEREVHTNGHLGPAHFMRSPLIRFQGQGGEPLAGRSNAEEYVFSEGEMGRVGVARRRGWNSSLGPPRLIASHGGCCFHATEAPDDWLLVVTEALTRRHWQLVAAEVTPAGRVEATRGVEENPTSAKTTYTDAEAINNAGQALIASSYQGEGESHAESVWLHGSARRCRAFSRTLFPSAEGTPAEESFPDLFAGAHDIFHLVWRNRQRQLETSTVRVGCAGA
jgi:hypothetical protein